MLLVYDRALEAPDLWLLLAHCVSAGSADEAGGCEMVTPGALLRCAEAKRARGRADEGPGGTLLPESVSLRLRSAGSGNVLLGMLTGPVSAAGLADVLWRPECKGRRPDTVAAGGRVAPECFALSCC